MAFSYGWHLTGSRWWTGSAAGSAPAATNSAAGCASTSELGGAQGGLMRMSSARALSSTLPGQSTVPASRRPSTLWTAVQLAPKGTSRAMNRPLAVVSFPTRVERSGAQVLDRTALG